MSQTRIFVRFQREGFHHWPAAPRSHAYLAQRHRHLFHVEVSMQAPTDGERTVEFHELIKTSQRVMLDVAKRGTLHDYGTLSCEEIADAVAHRISRIYNRTVTVTISEDSECGATVEAHYKDSETTEWDDGTVNHLAPTEWNSEVERSS